jgi:hypothetical protein
LVGDVKQAETNFVLVDDSAYNCQQAVCAGGRWHLIMGPNLSDHFFAGAGSDSVGARVSVSAGGPLGRPRRAAKQTARGRRAHHETRTRQ